MWEVMISTWQKYMGRGLLGIFFCAAWLYLFIREKEKVQRVLFVYVPLCVLILYFNPLFCRLFEMIGQTEIYFRVLWLIPFSMVLSYTAVKIGSTLSSPGKKIAFYVAMLVLVAAGGKNVYSSQLFSRAENMYHVPDSVVHICDAIEIRGREVTAVFPKEMLLYVRQYSPLVWMPYGRNALMWDWGEADAEYDLYLTMEEEEPDAQRLGSLARATGCVYIILPEDKRVQGDLAEQGYGFFDRIDGYIIYMDAYFEPWAWPDPPALAQ